MIKLRKILLCNYIYYIFLGLILIISIFRINYKYTSIYSNKLKEVTGIIKELSIDNDKVKITLNSKENIIGLFYYKNNSDKKYIEKSLTLGDKVLLKGELTRTNDTKTKGIFNYRKYLERRKIYYQVNIDKIYILSKNNNILYYLKNNIIKRCNNPYLKTFILGDTSDINDTILTNYRDIGISHLFAISGMHITLLSSILLSILKKLNVNEIKRYILVSIFLILYLFITGISPSVLRAVLFFIFFSINKVYYFYIKSTNIYYIVLGLSLLVNPFYIYEVSFLYSFIISYSLIVLQDFINSNNNYFSKLFKTSIISFIVSIPITLYNFNSINLLSIIYNLFYVPLISIIVFPLSIISFIFPKFLFILNIFISILESTTSILNKINLFKFIFKSIPIGIYFIYYILIMLFFKGIINNKKKLTILFIISLLTHYLMPYFDESDYLVMFDIGQGDSILIHTNNKNVLIDTGGIKSYNSKNKYYVTKNVTIPLLKKKGIKKIDYLILTHGDFDHLGDTNYLIDNFNVGKILINSNRINNLEESIIKKFPNIEIARKNYYFEIGDAQFLELNKNLEDENDSSLVFLVYINKKKILLTGDASIKSEEEIMKDYDIGNIDILKVGHHGSRTSSSKKLIKSINPKYAIISVGKNNRYGHPNKEVLSILSSSKIYRTDESGSIMFKIKKNKLEVEKFSP